MNCALGLYIVRTTYSSEHGLSKRWAQNMDLRTGKICFQFYPFQIFFRIIQFDSTPILIISGNDQILNEWIFRKLGSSPNFSSRKKLSLSLSMYLHIWGWECKTLQTGKFAFYIVFFNQIDKNLKINVWIRVSE